MVLRTADLLPSEPLTRTSNRDSGADIKLRNEKCFENVASALGGNGLRFRPEERPAGLGAAGGCCARLGSAGLGFLLFIWITLSLSLPFFPKR